MEKQLRFRLNHKAQLLYNCECTQLSLVMDVCECMLLPEVHGNENRD